MNCQVPGCQNKATKFSKKNVLSCGIFLENTSVWHCDHHTDEEIERLYDGEAEATQMVNPMVEVQKLKKKKS